MLLSVSGWCAKKGHGQAPAPQASPQAAAPESGGGGGGGQPSGKGFAIESEMLTYSAMDAESGTLACNIARNLGAADDKCAPRAMSNAPGVVIITGDSTALSEFQLWRGDISTMDILTRRANRYCPQAGQRGIISGIEGLLAKTPEGQILSIAKALFTTTSVKTPLEGNVLDQTLLNDIAGHLRAAGVSVVVPDTYGPHSLVTIDEARSPFLAKFLTLMTARGCLDEKPEGADHGAAADQPGDKANDQDRQAIARAIDGFLQTLTGPDMSKAPAPPAGGPPEPQAPSISHLNAVMRADGLAQEMGFDASSSGNGDNAPWTVLWLKALESGGDEVASDNLIKGSKTNYTGGAVGTYALFRLNGQLECSGVFYNLAGPVLFNDIPKFVDGSMIAGPGRLVGGCKAK
jgi:hypothetical protein